MQQPRTTSDTDMVACRRSSSTHQQQPEQEQRQSDSPGYPALPVDMQQLSERQRADLAFHLLATCQQPLITSTIARLHASHLRDFIAHLPHELSLLVLAHTDHATLRTAARVSRTWRRLAEDGALWRHLFLREGWRVDVAAVRRLVAQQQEHGAGGAHGLNDSGTLSCGTGGDATTAGMPYSGGTPRRRSSASLALLGAEEEEEALRSVRVSADAVGGGGGEHDSISPMEPPVYHNGMPVTSWRDVYRLRFALEQRWMTPVDSSETADNDTTIDTPPFHPSIRVLTGHQESVYCLQFDSRHIVSGSRDDTIKVWDIATAQCLRTLHGHTQSVLCLQFESPPTPDGWLVSGGSDARILVWNMHTGQVVREMRGHEDAVLNVRFDRRFVVSASKDRTVRLWDFKTGAAVRQFIGHKAAVNSVCMRDNTLVSASGDRTIKVWDITTGQCLRDLVGHQRGIACVQFDGVTIVSGSSDQTIKMWNVATGQWYRVSWHVSKCTRTINGHDDLVRTIQLTPHFIISGSYDMSIRIWNRHTGRLLRTLKDPAQAHTNRIFKLDVDATRVVSCAQDQRIVIWDFGVGLDVRLFV